ncbi:MAG TPA: GNAT family N-acetyltransferase [Nitrospira sp.]|nr:GNAT family N-acetyltransferase [Nitrospira sp.]
MTHTIRRAMLDDVDRLIPLFDAYRQFYGQPSDLTIARQFLHDRLARGESVVLLAEDHDKTAIGFAQLFPTFSSILAAPICILHDLYVTPAARRRRVGTLLLTTAVDTARAAGAARLELATAIANDPARRLYEKLGWRRDDEFYVYGFPLVSERAGNVHEECG